MRIERYRTVLHEGSGLYEEKRSRFLGRAIPVATEEEALGHIRAIRSEHWDARHHCFAYSITGESAVIRHSDDGEPGGTAGIPILEVIRRRELTQVLVVVTRWFGGVLLGAPGLVRAYGKAASAALDDAGEREVRTCLAAVLPMDYTWLGKVQAFMASHGVTVADVAYAENVRMTVYFEPAMQVSLEKGLADLTSAAVTMEFTDPVLAAFTAQGGMIEILDADTQEE